MVDETEWRNRLLVLTMLRLGGLGMIAAGAAAALTDWIQPGGDPVVASVLIVVGTLDSALAPFLLKRAWKPPPE